MVHCAKVVFLAVLALAVAAPGFCEVKDNPKEAHFKNIKQLTFEADNGEAYFSWDSSRLIWQSSRGDQACDKIWTMKIDGSDKKMVSPGHGAHTCSFYLPGDERVVFASTNHLEADCPPRPKIEGRHYVWPLWPYEIMVADADGGNMKALTDNPEYDAEPIVSSDGKSIVFGSKREGDFDIYTMDSDGGNVKRLTDSYGYDGGPWFSPDGTKIAWRAWHPKTAEEKEMWRDCMERNYIVPVPLDLWIMNADGTDKRRLTDNGAVNWAPSFHPDGKRLIFSSNMDDWREELGRHGHNFELYLIGVDGTNQTRLTFNDTFDSFPMFSPDGKKVVFGSNRTVDRPRQTDVFIADWVE
jgi:Tol biopolymer transport system component